MDTAGRSTILILG